MEKSDAHPVTNLGSFQIHRLTRMKKATTTVFSWNVIGPSFLYFSATTFFSSSSLVDECLCFPLCTETKKWASFRVKSVRFFRSHIARLRYFSLNLFVLIIDSLTIIWCLWL